MASQEDTESGCCSQLESTAAAIRKCVNHNFCTNHHISFKVVDDNDDDFWEAVIYEVLFYSLFDSLARN
jgi:hypothetical protein